jgi:acetyl esterase/lipase
LAQPAPNPIAPDGTVTVPSFRLPPSPYMSEEAKKDLPRMPLDVAAGLDRIAMGGPEVARSTRAALDKGALARLPALAAKYGVTVAETTVGGIRAFWTRPIKRVAANRGKVLINLPGGGFVMSSPVRGASNEAVPLAALVGVDILSVGYRQAPEAKFPAASEDVATVYRALLKTHKAKDIGIYGCSAGGLLTAQALAWFQKEGLPTPGAAGIFCASADARWAGDAWNWFKPLQGLTSAPTLDERFYYGDHDLSDPLMSPMESQEVLGRFPPTLLITATRAGELSAAVNTHRLLVKAGVEADLHVWDGLNHGFHSDPNLPESQEAYQVMARFFRRHLRVH